MMTEKRQIKLLNNFVGWFLDQQTSAEGLFRDLHIEIGMTQEEIEDYGIDIAKQFEKARKEQEEAEGETIETLTAEDLVEQTVYLANAPDGATAEDKSEAMLGMIGANIVDESIYEEPDCEKEVEESIVAEFKDFKIDKTAGRTTGEVFDDAYEISVKTSLKDAVCEGDFEDNVYKALLQNRGEILRKLYDVYQGTPSASVATNTDAESFVEWYAEKYLKVTMQEPIKMGM